VEISPFYSPIRNDLEMKPTTFGEMKQHAVAVEHRFCFVFYFFSLALASPLVRVYMHNVVSAVVPARDAAPTSPLSGHGEGPLRG
jgi:hypothetical protein